MNPNPLNARMPALTQDTIDGDTALEALARAHVAIGRYDRSECVTPMDHTMYHIFHKQARGIRMGDRS